MRARGLLVCATVLFSVGLLSSTPGELVAQGQREAALRGVVSSREEGKMEGVVITARRDGANFSTTIVSDARGEYIFPRTHLVPGSYVVTIRAVGYDLTTPGTVQVTAGKAATLDLTLQKTKDLGAQLTSLEWLMSMPGTPDQKNRLVNTVLSCAYCHTYKRIMRSKHSAEEFVTVIRRMQSYYPDGSAVGDDGRGRGQKMLKFGNSLGRPTPPAPDAPQPGANWGRFAVQELADYLASLNLSGGRTTWPYELKTLPRPKGKETRVIVTQWDLPRRTTVAHDMEMDEKGTPWYTDEGAQVLGKLDPKTNTFKEYPMPPVPPDSLPGTRDIVADHDGNLWFSVRVAGGASLLSKFDPKTEKLDMIEGAAGQFVALAPDHKIWINAGNDYLLIDMKAMKVIGTYSFAKAANLPPGRHAGYQQVADSQGNMWMTDYVGSNVFKIDAKTGEAKFFPLPTTDSLPRRGKMDSQDRYWFAEYGGDKFAMFDTKTEQVREWPVPNKYTTPYSSSVPDKNGRVWSASNTAERLLSLDPKTGEILQYLMPTDFDAKNIVFDPTANRVNVWLANTRTAKLMRVEPLD